MLLHFFSLLLTIGGLLYASAQDVDLLGVEEPEQWDPTLVSVHEGKLKGVQEEAINGKQFYSFRNIPYAKPPVGEKRFEVSKCVSFSNYIHPMLSLLSLFIVDYIFSLYFHG